jgi:hypothetical protein
MDRCNHHLPGFTKTCLAACGLFTALAGSVLLRGVRASMAAFGVPKAMLSSPHYEDAIWWVYTHMLILGLLIGLIGITAEGDRQKRWFAHTMLGANLYYTFLDARSSDTFLGNGLYQGVGSLAPALVGAGLTVLFVHLSFCRAAREAATG